MRSAHARSGREVQIDPRATAYAFVRALALIGGPDGGESL
jgi:hypothetical protein